MNIDNRWILAIIAVLFIGGGLVFHFWLAPKIFLTQVDSAHDIIDITYDAENAIYNYEWFKNQHQKIEATERQIDNTHIQIDEMKELYGNATNWEWETKQEHSRLKATVLGQQNYYETLVADYNARSSMANRNIFKNKLPFNVDKKIW